MVYYLLDDKKRSAQDNTPLSKREQKRRKKAVIQDQQQHSLCKNISIGKECPFGPTCKYSHDVDSYLSAKPQDFSDRCHLYYDLGKCEYGLACRAARSHMDSNRTPVLGNNFIHSHLQSIQTTKQNSIHQNSMTSLLNFKLAYARNKFHSQKVRQSCVSGKKKREREQLRIRA